MTSRVLEDRKRGIAVEIADGGMAHVLWHDMTNRIRACCVDARELEVGRWIPMRQEDKTDDEPPIYVVCRATALVVGASIKADVLEALKGLP